MAIKMIFEDANGTQGSFCHEDKIVSFNIDPLNETGVALILEKDDLEAMKVKIDDILTWLSK